MKADEFVGLMKKEKEMQMEMYFGDLETSLTGIMIAKLVEQGVEIDSIKKLVSNILDETYYGILMGLEGESSIGGEQICYKLFDEDGNSLTGDGILEESAYENFMEDTR